MEEPSHIETHEARAAQAVGVLTLCRVFWRSLFLQAAWNPEGMQNLGFAYALYPALQKLYRDPQKLAEATERHLCHFNCHPYAAAAIVGGVAHHEARIARGLEPVETANEFKQSLMGPLAAVGDGFFWLSLRPALGALAAMLALLLAEGGAPGRGLLAVVLFLVAYNVVHLGLRAWLFVSGWKRGDAIIESVAASHLPYFGTRLRTVAAASVGAVAGMAGGLSPGLSGASLGWSAVGWGLFVASWLLLGRGVSPYALFYGAASLMVVAGVVL